MGRSSFFGDDFDQQIAAKRDAAKASAVFGKIWPNNDVKYGDVTREGDSLEGQIVGIATDEWEKSGDERTKIILRTVDGIDYAVTLDRYTKPEWDESPARVGDYVYFETWARQYKGKQYQNLTMLIKAGNGKITIDPAKVEHDAAQEEAEGFNDSVDDLGLD